MKNKWQRIKHLDLLFEKGDVLENVPEDIDSEINYCIKNEKLRVDHGYSGIKRLLPRIIAATIFIILLIPSVYFILQKDTHLQTSVILISGEGNIIRKEKPVNLQVGMQLKEGDVLYTDDNSGYKLQLSENCLLDLGEETQIRFKKIKKKIISLILDYGRISVALDQPQEHKLIFKTITKQYITKCISAGIFIISHNNDQTIISPLQGKLESEKITEKQKAQSFSIKAGKTNILLKDESVITTDISKEESDLLKTLKISSQLDMTKKYATLNINTDMDAVVLKIDDKQIRKFDRKISIAIKPGSYLISLEKDEYKSFHSEIEAVPGKKILINKKLDKIQMKNENQKKLIIDKTYTFMNPDNQDQNMIYGFVTTDNVIIAVTKTTLLAFNKKGQILWTASYGEKKKIIFEALPVVYNNKLYCTSIYTIIVIDLITGRELKRIDAPGILSDNQQLIITGHKVYIPYPEGIYILNLNTETVSKKPFIQYENSNTPLFINDNIYLSSFVKKQVILFNLKGQKIKEAPLKELSICSPVPRQEKIIAGDIKGNLYFFSWELSFLNMVNLSSGINSLIVTSNDLWITTLSGVLYRIDPFTYRITHSFPIDSQSDIANVYYKKPLLFDNSLIIGTNKGEIKAINIKSGSETSSIKVSDSAISCSLYKQDDTLFTGTETGEILKVKYQ